MRFEVNVVDLATNHILQELEKYEVIRDAVVEKIEQLRMTINVVRKEKDYIEQVTQPVWWHRFTYDDIDELVERLAPLMKYDDDENSKSKTEKFDIRDELAEKSYVEFGPEHERMTVQKYREKVEQIINDMISSNPVLQKLKNGIEIGDDEVNELADILESRDPWVTEEILRKVYDNKRAKFIQIIKHILGLEELKSFTKQVSEAIDSFIAEHNTYSKLQIDFILTLKTFILQKGAVSKKDLVHEPFTKLDPEGILGLFKPSEIEEIIEFTNKLAA